MTGRRRSRLGWVLALAGTVVGSVCLSLCGCVWSRLPYYDLDAGSSISVDLLSDPAFEEVFDSFPRPYIVELDSPDGGAVLVFGAEHTRDPNDPQIQVIRDLWHSFAPTVALCESRLGILFPWFMDPVETFCEPGAVAALARESGVPAYTWEPREESVTCDLLQHFTPEQVALSVVLRPYFSNLRHGRPADPEGYVAEFLDRAAQPGLDGVIGSVEEIDRIWAREFANQPDWRDVSDEYGLPGYLAEVAARANRGRTTHLARALLELARRGERVFAVAGSSHAVKVEPALRAGLDVE